MSNPVKNITVQVDVDISTVLEDLSPEELGEILYPFVPDYIDQCKSYEELAHLKECLYSNTTFNEVINNELKEHIEACDDLKLLAELVCEKFKKEDAIKYLITMIVESNEITSEQLLEVLIKLLSKLITKNTSNSDSETFK